MGNKLEEKTAIVTACTRGIGKAIVTTLAKEGASVCMGVRNIDLGKQIASGINEKLGRKAVTVYFYDGFDTDSIQPMLDLIYQDTNKLDILVNNQGGMGKGVTDDLDLLHTSTADFKSSLDFNLVSTYSTCQAAVPYMIKSGGGTIINIASMNGEFADMARIGYGVSKYAIDKLTQNIAMQYGRSNIRCNAVAPGFIRTDAALALPQSFIDGYIKHLPIRRLGEVEDIANAVLFFASEDSAWVSGQVLQVAGGFGCGTPMYADMVEPSNVPV